MYFPNGNDQFNQESLKINYKWLQVSVACPWTMQNLTTDNWSVLYTAILNLVLELDLSFMKT